MSKEVMAVDSVDNRQYSRVNSSNWIILVHFIEGI